MNCFHVMQNIDPDFLTSLHSRLLSVVRPKLSKLVEDKLTEEQLGEKLSKLDKIVAGTEHPTSHKAWRPVTGAVNLGLAAHDLKVVVKEKEEPELVLQQLDSEVEKLEEKIMEEGRRMSANMAVITSNEEMLRNIGNKLSKE